MPFGMAPVRLLFERDNTVMEVRLMKSAGMVPMSWLESRLRI